MSVGAAPWEAQLLDWAHEGIHSAPTEDCNDAALRNPTNAYALCAAMTRQHSRTFFLASSLLPRNKRRAVRALYAFCRTSDDIVDRPVVEGEMGPEAALAAWRERAMGKCEDHDDLLIRAWSHTQATYGIPRLYAEQLIDGVDRDLRQTRYATFTELAAYCYGVASTVGLMAMHIVGFSGSEALPHAVRLGVALQLTNILRDVGEDWHAGRLYLPQEELTAFGLEEADIAAEQVDDRWRALMRFQIDRIRHLYADSLCGVRFLHRDGRFAVAAAAELYQAILLDIEAHDFDVFHRRAHTTRGDKLRRLPGIWWRANVAGYSEVVAGYSEVVAGYSEAVAGYSETVAGYSETEIPQRSTDTDRALGGLT